jgi:hypothetical protein
MGLAPSQGNGWVKFQPTRSRKVGQISTGADNTQAPSCRGQDAHRLEGLRGEESIAALCRREAIAESLYYAWPKEFLEAGKWRLAGDTARAATSDEVKALRQEARALKEVVAEQA